MIKLRESVYIIPHFPVRSMENMRPVFMHLNFFCIFRKNISRYIGTFIYHKTGLVFFFHFVCENCAEQSCANYQIIVMHFAWSPFILTF